MDQIVLENPSIFVFNDKAITQMARPEVFYWQRRGESMKASRWALSIKSRIVRMDGQFNITKLFKI
jgi:hypothetical protein